MNRGFIALTMVIMVASISFAFVAVNSIETAHYFDQVVQKKYRLMSYHFAHNCIDQALLELAHDFFYTHDVSRKISDLHCVIDSVVKEDDIRIISVHGDYKNVKVYREARVRLYENSLDLLSVE